MQRTFSALAEELSVLMKEEQVLFPYVVRLEESFLSGEPAPPAMFGTVVNPVRMMMQEHDSAGDALRKLRMITKDYSVPEDACISYRTLYEALRASRPTCISTFTSRTTSFSHARSRWKPGDNYFAADCATGWAVRGQCRKA